MAHPIWKDYYVNLVPASFGSIGFAIIHDGKVIYTGKAYARPNEEYIFVRINDICADYMVNNLGKETAMLFNVAIDDEGIWESIDGVTFINDWSYDDSHDPESMGLSAPINGHLSPNQWLIYTDFAKDLVTMHFDDCSVVVPLTISSDFNADFNADFTKSVEASHTDTAVLDLSQYSGITRVSINSKDYKVVDGCRYALYYRNAYSGWDSFLIEGNHSETDSIERHIREVDYNNTRMERAKHVYAAEISKMMTLHTSWLSDAEASRMHHLLNSTEVYLCDIEADKFIPVVLTNTSTEYKTYKGNGGKLVNYAIEVAFANDRVRR